MQQQLFKENSASELPPEVPLQDGKGHPAEVTLNTPQHDSKGPATRKRMSYHEGTSYCQKETEP